MVDCTGACPGDEETLKVMMNMMDNKTLEEKYPVIAQMKNKTESGGGNQDRFLQMLQGKDFIFLVYEIFNTA